MSNDVVLILPPQWTLQNPPFALACLGGHLRSRGIATRLLDLNLDYYLDVLTPQHMRYVQQVTQTRRTLLSQKCRLRLQLNPGSQSPELSRDAAHLLRLERFLEADPWSQVAAALPQALAVMRSDAFYDADRLMDALITIDRALELAALPYFPGQLALNNYYNQEYAFNLDSLEHATRDDWGNMFISFMRHAVPRILEDGAPILAISINSFSQVVAGLTLARLLKAAAPVGTHVSIGGNFFGRVADRLMQMPRFFELFCDSVVIGEGEEALERLCRGPIQQVPETIWRDPSGALHRNRRAGKRMPLAEAGYLDLAGLSLDRYLTPAPVLCMQTSRGCYYGKCTFCDAYWGVPLDKKPIARVVAEMRHLRERYGIRHFELIDECLPPQEMRALAEAIIAEGLDVRWFANARLEPEFVDNVQPLYDAGATMLLWGFESGSPRLLKKMAKGVNAESRWQVLRASAEAGVWNFAYIFFGFPGETSDDANQTIEAICQHTDLIHSYGRSLFSLGLHSPMARKPQSFGVSAVREEGDELSVNVTFDSEQGPTPDALSQTIRECTERCRQAYGSPLWMGLRNRENLHLYLARFSTEKVAAWSIRHGELAFQK